MAAGEQQPGEIQDLELYLCSSVICFLNNHTIFIRSSKKKFTLTYWFFDTH